MAGAAAADFSMPPAGGAAAAKRRRQPPAADPPEGLSMSSSSSEGSEGGSRSAKPGRSGPARTAGSAGMAAQQAVEPAQGNSKKARPGMSPPRLVLNCGLFEPGSAEPQLKLSGGSSGSRRLRASGAFWPVAAGGGTALNFGPAMAEEDDADAGQEQGGQQSAEHAGADDPFSRPAAHDPLLDEEARPTAAARPAAAPVSTACVPASACCTGAACCSPEPPSAPASGRAAGGANPFGAAPSLSLAMELLQRGALMLSCLEQPLSDRTRADLAEIAASLSRMAAPGPDVPAVAAPPPLAAAHASNGRENTRSNGNSNSAAGGGQPWPAGWDPVAFKAEILRELRQELHMGQQ